MADEKPAGFETKENKPGYHPAATANTDLIAQGVTPGISNTPGNDSWDGSEEADSEEKSAPARRSGSTSSKAATESK